MRKFSKMLAFALAAAMVFTAFAPAAKADAAEKAMAINKQGKILYVTDGTGINDAGAPGVEEGKGNVSEYDFAVSNKPADYKEKYTFTWLSSDEKVITVGKAGLTKAVGVGTADVLCVVTEKATGNSKLLKNTITVKANADKVAIKTVKVNGEEVAKEDLADMGELAVGTVVDLDRVMYDKAGNDTTKKGTFVTDSTRWFAKDAEGKVVGEEVVKITNKNGQFKFLVPGEYTLYCETYQSNTYKGTTASTEKDDPIVVTIAEFKPEIEEIEQTTVKKFTVKFDKAVASLATDAVTVERMDAGFALPELVKTATLAKDGMSVEVEMYTTLKNNVKYLVTVDGYGSDELLASAGDPVEVLIYVDEKEMKAPYEYVFIDGTPVTLSYRLVDAKGVDVTDVAGGTVLFNAKEYSTDGSYYVSANQMWFAKEGVDVEVVADYQSGRYENGVQLAPAKGEKLFRSAKKDPVKVIGIDNWKIAGVEDDWSDAKKTVAFKETATLAVKVKLSEGDPVVASHMGSVLDGYITFKELNPEVAALNGSQIVFFKQGTAKILVCYNYTDATTSQLVEVPLYQVNAEATAERALQSMKLDKQMITLGTVDGHDEEIITVTAKDNYTGDYDVSGKVSIEGVDDNSKAALKENVSYKIAADGKITLYGYELKENTPNKPDTVQLTFKVKVDGKLEQNVTVLLKSRGAVGTEYIQLVADGFGGDVARTVASKDAKTGSFTVYQYSNGIKVGTQEVKAYPSDANAITADTYYFKVQKDGTDITAKFTDAADGKVTVNFSSLDNGVVKYTDFGAGTYVFTLYKGVAVAADKAIAVQQNTAAGSVTCNAGNYGSVVRVKDNLNGDTSDAAIFAAFEVKNTKSEKATTFYSIDKEIVDNYVYVKSITFRDNVTGTDGIEAYAEYTVSVGVAVRKNAN